MNQRIEEDLKNFIGKNIIRTNPTVLGEKSFLEYPVKLVDIWDDRLIVKGVYGTESEKMLNEECILNSNYTDKNWILYKDVLKIEEKYADRVGKIILTVNGKEYKIVSLNDYFSVCKDRVSGKCEIKNLSNLPKHDRRIILEESTM